MKLRSRRSHKTAVASDQEDLNEKTKRMDCGDRLLKPYSGAGRRLEDFVKKVPIRPIP